MRDEIVTRMEISLDHIVHNYRTVAAHVSPAVLVAVVKSEAYGHGASPVARALQAAGCTDFAIALVDEGVQLRRAGIGGRIIVMGATLPSQHRAMIAHGLTPVLPDLDHLAAWDEAARQAGQRLGYHLKVDVGLGRMGLLPEHGEEAARAVATTTSAELLGISGHLSAPEGPDELNQVEEERFHTFCRPILKVRPGAKRHLAASLATARYRRMHLDMVRIGALLYGIRHLPEHPLDLRAAMSFKTQVAQVKTLPAGWYVGYGMRLKLTRATRIALLPLGWTDIFSTAMRDRAGVLIQGEARPLIGLCTDFAMVDVSDGTGPAPSPGDEAVIIGTQGQASVSAVELGRTGDISTGQLLGKISLRVPRVYTLGGRECGELSILCPGGEAK